ncbi:unnamed protein product [Paramecium pentaurelia]|uniref:J domain-containing protein n=1 Tax=Paramecium pentaurelia TaxID=43138 RepID=A0A8S1S7W5_9CILI|nr:unnamed protein product [Paramecium pentaurelia]
MNQIIHASLQRNEFYNKSYIEKQVSNQTSSTEKSCQMDTEFDCEMNKKVQSTCDSSVQGNSSHETNFIKCENTPQIHQKMESLCIDEESFNLDEVLFNECDNLSHISENANICEKWQEESIHSFIYEQKVNEEEEERKLKENNYFYLLKQMEETVKIERIPEHLKNIIESLKFKVLSIGPLKLQCQEGHQWEAKFDDLTHDYECKQCHDIKQSQQKSKFNQQSQNQQPKKHGKCILNPQHPGSTRCKECKQLLKQQLKKQKQENIRQTNDMYEKLQNELYMKAVRLLSQGNTAEKQKIIRAFRETEVEVDKAAMNHANRYCAKQGIISSEQLQQIMVVYKMLLLPEGALKKYAQSQQKAILKQEYKTYAKSVHPDKNSHPQCCVAFQKLKKFWVDIPKTGMSSDISSSQQQ